MGLVETLLERVSIPVALILAVGGYVFYKVCVRMEQNFRLARLGARGHIIHNRLPFGEFSNM